MSECMYLQYRYPNCKCKHNILGLHTCCICRYASRMYTYVINQLSREGQSVNAHVDSGEYLAHRLVTLSCDCLHPMLRSGTYTLCYHQSFSTCSCSLMWPATNNNRAATHVLSRARGVHQIQKISIPKCDRHTYRCKSDAKQD